MIALWNDATLAEADKEDLIRIEGNWYFPPASIKNEYFSRSTHQTMCFWKGQAAYYDLVVNGKKNEAAAWYYPEPMEGAIERVGKDFTDFVAFWHGVEVKE